MNATVKVDEYIYNFVHIGGKTFVTSCLLLQNFSKRGLILKERICSKRGQLRVTESLPPKRSYTPFNVVLDKGLLPVRYVLNR